MSDEPTPEPEPEPEPEPDEEIPPGNAIDEDDAYDAADESQE